MGHSQTQKQQTHESIVQLAAQRFRELGLEGLSIANLMKEAGLTHGGFYKHFESRDDLVAEALAAALESNNEARMARRDTFETSVEAYLNRKHRDSPGNGCAVSALVNDIGRARGDARAIYTAQVRNSLSRIAGLLGTADGASHDAEALVAYSAMVGALCLSRAVDDPALSAKIMTTVREYLVAQFAPATTSDG
ncbi:hypothetical protein AU476_29075 [Cupriavidus sp. UYMSc13B]|nr:hypothetical protein AU476_29075 [Cupriavidus sp. UYMSc13B]